VTEISVVVPTYNRLETLAHVVPTLLAQNLDSAAYEVLVCDSNSSDGTAEYLAQVSERHPTVRHLPGTYSGRAAARNAGIAAARGEIVLFNDADILASNDLLSTHLRRHRENERQQKREIDDVAGHDRLQGDAGQWPRRRLVPETMLRHCAF